MVKELVVHELCKRCNPDELDFETTAELEPATQVLGQKRAVEAIKFGMGMNREGYNIFALGPDGSSMRQLVQEFFQERAQDATVPSDWVYVHNFENPHQPRAIELPAGKGIEFQKDMAEMVDALRTALSSAFESEEYQTRRQALTDEVQERQSQAFEALQEKARQHNVAIIRTPAGLAVAPVRDGEVLSQEEVQKLSEEEQKELRQEVEAIQEELQKIMQQVPGWQREMREKVNALQREVAAFAVGGLLDELESKHADFPPILQHLTAVEKDAVEQAEGLLQVEQEMPSFLQALAGGPDHSQRSAGPLRKYQVNLLIDHSKSEGAPVIFEDNPTYQNLIGRVEHMAQMGALMTDFTLIQAGALHKANGGYLLLDARKVLTQPYAWEGLKRALQSKQIRIESLGQMLSVISTVSLEPEPIPLDVKVGIYGNRMIYYLLIQLDPEFAELFKVEADLEDEMDWSPENQRLYARMIATMVQQEELRPFDRMAVARVLEHSSRLVGDSAKLTTRTRDVGDLLREADYWAGQDGNGEVVSAAHVEQAIQAQIERADRVRDRMQESILRGTHLVDTDGVRVGQVNGLSVMQLGNFAFGRPTRISARVWLGKGEVVDIEREVDLGGPIHSKGVLILAGYLGGHYVQGTPLALSASLVFEQSYGGVEGDSASSAELYALLSAISEIPISQSLAVTGSVNQYGQVQAIGGANEKIEGFFDICKARGLNGEQGVLIPESNVKNLMLRHEVVEAVEKGQFHIYPVETVDQGIEILTGVAAGQRDETGRYPEDTVNGRVARRLGEMARKRQEFAKLGKEDDS